MLLGLTVQAAALLLMHLTVRGQWLRHIGAMLLGMAFVYHGFTELQQWAVPTHNKTRLQASPELIAGFRGVRQIFKAKLVKRDREFVGPEAKQLLAGGQAVAC